MKPIFAGNRNQMKKTQDNIAALVRGGVPVALKSDDFRYSELASLARLAASSETTMTLVVGDNLTAAEVSDLARTAHGHMHVDLTR